MVIIGSKKSQAGRANLEPLSLCACGEFIALFGQVGGGIKASSLHLQHPKMKITAMPPPRYLTFLLLLSLLPPSHAALLAPIAKDYSTGQYTLTLSLKTPPQPTTLLLDLGASFTWLDCTHNYTSSSYRHIPCSAPLCSSLHSLSCSNCFAPPRPGCANDSCSLFPENPITRTAIAAEAILDSLTLLRTDGRNPGQPVSSPGFVFSCSVTSLLQGLAKEVSGLAGLGRSNVSLPAQVSALFSDPYLFALCLSGSYNATGVAFFNSGGPYFFLPGIDLAKTLIYTPLILNPVGSTVITYYEHPSDEYFIGVTSIKVNGKDVPLNKTLLAIDENGSGGTKISTVVPFTVLHSSIYEAFTDAFVRESAALNLTVTEAVKPFSVCYPAGEVFTTRVGPAVPTVDLVMQSDDVFWRVFGANSMVRIAGKDADLWCLGFVDGGANPRASIVIGGNQMEDNLLQFDVGLKRFGFSSSVLVHGTTCADFNFTSNDNR